MFVFSHLFCPLDDNNKNQLLYQGSYIVQTVKEALMGNCRALRTWSGGTVFSLSTM